MTQPRPAPAPRESPLGESRLDPEPSCPVVCETGRHGPARLLAAMHRDGLLVPVGPRHYLRADAARWPPARRVVLRAVLGPDLVAAMDCAAWAWGGPPPPGPDLDVIVPAQTGGRPGQGLRLRRCTLSADEVCRVDGLCLTSPARTAADLALWADPGSDPAFLWLLAEVGVDRVRQDLSSRQGPGSDRARRVLAVAAAGARDPIAQVSSGRCPPGTRRTRPTPASPR